MPQTKMKGNIRTQLDLDFVRQQFPNIDESIFFENAGGTLVPKSVSDRVFDYMRRNQVQPGAPYLASMEAQDRIQRSHEKLAAMVNADPSEIVVGHSTTMNIYILANAVRHLLQPGDEIVVTNLDHEANNGAWRRLAEFGVVIQEWKIDPTTGLLGGVDDLRSLMNKRTKLVCFTLCSNITGSINDVVEITRAVHEFGALVCVDAVAYAPHRILNMKEFEVDFCVFSLYKLYGPHLGVLYGKQEHLLKLPGQNHFFIAKNDLPAKFLVGGYLHETAASIEGIPEYIDILHRHHFKSSNRALADRYEEVFQLIAEHEEILSKRFLEYLKSKPKVKLLGSYCSDREVRVPTFSFLVKGRKSDEIARKLGERQIGISNGHFYAKRCIDALGVTDTSGVVRVSMVHYNTESEVDRLIAELDRLIG